MTPNTHNTLQQPTYKHNSMKVTKVLQTCFLRVHHLRECLLVLLHTRQPLGFHVLVLLIKSIPHTKMFLGKAF